MRHFRIKQIAFKVGVISLLIGAVALTLSWNTFGGELPGYQVLLLPGIVFMLPFTEELDLGLKVVLLLGGQFLVSSVFTIVLLRVYFFVKTRIQKKSPKHNS